MKIVVFEDEHVSRLYPVTLGRPAYAISCGSFRLLDWLQLLEQPIHGIVRPHLETIQTCDYAHLGDGSLGQADDLLFVNARMVPSRTAFEILQKIIATKQSGVARCDDETAAFLVPRLADRPE